MTTSRRAQSRVVQHQTDAEVCSNQQTEDSPLTKLLKRIHHAHEFPSISKYLIEINQKLAADPDMANASDLANVILKDYALTNKLLKLVNSAFYGLAAGKVTTVTRAVVVLGFENIRLATLSLVLFEHFQSKSNIADLKEVVINSFWAGMLARDIAKMSDGIDAEEAYVCAMMNQLGKLLMIYYQPDKYRQIRDRMFTHKENETKAAKMVCGVTYDELGMAVAKQWSFPSQICNSMPVLSSSELKDKKRPPEKLWALSSFVKELGTLICTGRPDNQKEDIANLHERYRNSIKISKGQLKTLLRKSLEKVQKHAAAMNFSIDKSNFLNNLTNYSDPTRPAQDAGLQNPLSDLRLSDSFQLTDSEEIKANSQPSADKSPKDIIMDGIQEISEAMMEDLDVNDVALMSLEVLYRALKFHRALMFVREGNKKIISVRYGYGRGVQPMLQKVGFETTEARDLFNLSIREGKDLIVADAYDPKLNELIPSWYRRYIDAPAFIFFPVLFKKICIGAFYADRNKDGVPINAEEHRHLSMLRNQLVLAIKYR